MFGRKPVMTPSNGSRVLTRKMNSIFVRSAVSPEEGGTDAAQSEHESEEDTGHQSYLAGH